MHRRNRAPAVACAGASSAGCQDGHAAQRQRYHPMLDEEDATGPCGAGNRSPGWRGSLGGRVPVHGAIHGRSSPRRYPIFQLVGTSRSSDLRLSGGLAQRCRGATAMGTTGHLMPRQPVPDLSLPLAGGGRWRLSDQKPKHFTMLAFTRSALLGLPELPRPAAVHACGLQQARCDPDRHIDG